MMNNQSSRLPVLNQWLGWGALILIIAQWLLVILSWLISVTNGDGVRSLLSSEGIRWFIGNFTDLLASPLLVWFLLLLSAFGCFQKSGIVSCHKPMSYRERIALRVALAFLLIYIVVIGLLTLAPHAILLSATGHLFPSAFSRSIIPLFAFGVCLFSITFGLMSGRLHSMTDILHALSFGIAKGSTLVILLMLALQFYESLMFVIL